MKKYLYGIIIVIAVASLVGAYVINKSTGPNKNSFSLQAADSDLSSFKELLQAKVTSVKDETEEQNKWFRKRPRRTSKLR
jgi:O-antigen ligase